MVDATTAKGEQSLIDAVWTALAKVQDPELFKDLVTLKMVKEVRACNGAVSIDIDLTTPACPMRSKIEKDVSDAVLQIPGAASVAIKFGASVRPSNDQRNILPDVRNVIAVGAGKGGVGKSTVAVNIAVGLALAGAKVGLLDADVYGPSIPIMTGLSEAQPSVVEEKIIPFNWGSASQPIKVMSIGFIVQKEKALIWRGPMVHGVIRQFLEQVQWGELDYLIVDLPPGTGDVSLTLAQSIPLTGAVIIATPQEVALADARRAVRMFQQLGVWILGVVENMSYFVCEHGTRYDLFGSGGAQQMAQDMSLPFIGQLPLDMSVRINSDRGDPFANFSGKMQPQMTSMVETLAGQISIRNLTRPPGKAVKLDISA